MTITATINGHAVEAGCYIDGHWGQYGPDRMADLAEGWGAFEDGALPDPRVIRNLIDASIDGGAFEQSDRIARLWDSYHYAFEDVERWIEDHADACYVDWEDGEWFVSVPDLLEELSAVDVCHDCYFAHHYGRTFHDGEWYAGESDQPSDRKPLGLFGDVERHDLTDWTYDESDPENDANVRWHGSGNTDFSMSSCGGCGSHLGGARFRLAY